MKKESIFINSKGAAIILDCSPDEVNELARNKKIKAIKHNRYWKFRISDVKKFKEKKQK
jgi:hypothetical protein